MRRKTHEEFLQQMQKINDNIEIFSKYETCNTIISCRCKICGYEWETKADNLLQSKGCKQCSFNKMREIRLKSHDQFIKDVYKVNKNIEILSKYSGAKNNVECKCLLHNTKFDISADHLLKGKTGCRDCINIKFHLSGLKSHQQFMDDLKSINGNIEVLGEYDGAKVPIKVKCLKCGHIWNPIADSLLHGYGCPHCRSSKGEEKIELYLTTRQIKFESQKKFEDLRNALPLSYDFYLPEYNMLIEYQGQFHDGTASMVDKNKYFEKQKYNDTLKRQYAINHNYNLLEIWYYDFDNLDNIIDTFIYNLKNPVTTTAI